jgi:phenylacetaldehyde dehydrogenase
MVLKPSEMTPANAVIFAEILHEAGVPKGVFNLVNGGGPTAGHALAAHPDVDLVSFTGSTGAGITVAKAAADTVKRVLQELGGKSPNIILGDADVEAAIDGATAGIFFNHGQCCNAGSRLFVQENIFDKVVAGIAANAGKIKLGVGMDPATEMGPLVSQVQYGRVTGYLKAGLEEGARALTGGKAHGNNGYFVQPTVLVDTTPQMKVVKEEIFGPVLVATPFKEVDDGLIAAANDTIYGLAAGVWSGDMAKAQRIANRIKAGTVWINCYHVFDSALPFGGYKQSGWGREMGQAVLSNYLETKAITSRIG